MKTIRRNEFSTLYVFPPLYCYKKFDVKFFLDIYAWRTCENELYGTYFSTSIKIIAADKLLFTHWCLYIHI